MPIVVPGQHKAIIDRDLFERVQVIVASRRPNGDGKGGRTSRHPALFTNGHLRCGRCGAAMGTRRKPRTHANGKTYVWKRYVCTAASAPCWRRATCRPSRQARSRRLCSMNSRRSRAS